MYLYLIIFMYVIQHGDVAKYAQTGNLGFQYVDLGSLCFHTPHCQFS